jgi:hypothetical protein
MTDPKAIVEEAPTRKEKGSQSIVAVSRTPNRGRNGSAVNSHILKLKHSLIKGRGGRRRKVSKSRHAFVKKAGGCNPMRLRILSKTAKNLNTIAKHARGVALHTLRMATNKNKWFAQNPDWIMASNAIPHLPVLTSRESFIKSTTLLKTLATNQRCAAT